MERVNLYGFDYWKLECKLEGISALLMHSAAVMLQTKTPTRGKNIPTPEDEAERALYRNDDGQLFIPAIALRNCALEACSRGDFRVGRRSLKSLLSAAMLIEPEEIILHRNGKPVTTWEIDSRRVVVQRQGVVRSRALIKTPWEATATVMVDATLYATEESLVQLGELFGFAGQFIGILDYRPARSGWFGRFKASLK